jgi:hypothetical protein
LQFRHWLGICTDMDERNLQAMTGERIERLLEPKHLSIWTATLGPR